MSVPGTVAIVCGSLLALVWLFAASKVVGAGFIEGVLKTLRQNKDGKQGGDEDATEGK